jgi:hypothetical protein
LVLRKQGIEVMARFSHAFGRRRFFTYTDLTGRVHEIQADYAARGIGGDQDRINVVYDPRHPGKAVCTLAASTLVFRTTGIILLGGLLLSIGFLMMPFQLMLLAFT